MREEEKGSGEDRFVDGILNRYTIGIPRCWHMVERSSFGTVMGR